MLSFSADEELCSRFCAIGPGVRSFGAVHTATASPCEECGWNCKACTFSRVVFPCSLLLLYEHRFWAVRVPVRAPGSDAWKPGPRRPPRGRRGSRALDTQRPGLLPATSLQPLQAAWFFLRVQASSSDLKCVVGSNVLSMSQLTLTLYVNM